VAGRGASGAAFAELGARSNFSLLDGASHPEELVETAAALGLAGLAVCDANSLAGVVRAHVAAKRAGLRFAVGARVVADDGAEYLVWVADRAAYGRLTRLLSLGRTRAPKAEGCRLSRAELLAHAEGGGWAVALVPPRPPALPDAAFAARLRADAEALRGDEISAASTSSPRWPPRNGHGLLATNDACY
jgi:error-prone DNA polymerase